MKIFSRLLLLLLLLSGGVLLYYKNPSLFRSFFNKSSSDSLQTALISLDKEFPQEKFIANLLLKSPCENTLYYSLGNIDERHNISSEELLSVLKKAESIWEKPTGYNLFEYKEGASFKINLIFDDRQKQVNDFLKLDEKLKDIDITQKSLSQKYSSLLDEHKKALKKYHSSLKKLNAEASDYSEEVEYWNKKGGAPPEKYQELKKWEEKINELNKKVEHRRNKVNALVEKINSLVKQEKQVTGNYNIDVSVYKKKYGPTRQFDQGEYFGEDINVYEFKNTSELLLILAHELGHALGIGHTKNPHSIMYYLMEKQNLKNPQLTTEDLSALKNICEK